MSTLPTSPYPRKALAGVIFMMAFLMTPRAWVDVEQPGAPGAIPVQSLQHQAPVLGEDCLWCEEPTLTPVDCERDAPSEATHHWLNPDAPPPKAHEAPCLEPLAKPIEPRA